MFSDNMKTTRTITFFSQECMKLLELTDGVLKLLPLVYNSIIRLAATACAKTMNAGKIEADITKLLDSDVRFKQSFCTTFVLSLPSSDLQKKKKLEWGDFRIPNYLLESWFGQVRRCKLRCICHISMSRLLWALNR